MRLSRIRLSRECTDGGRTALVCLQDAGRSCAPPHGGARLAVNPSFFRPAAGGMQCSGENATPCLEYDTRPSRAARSCSAAAPKEQPVTKQTAGHETEEGRLPSSSLPQPCPRGCRVPSRAIRMDPAAASETPPRWKKNVRLSGAREPVPAPCRFLRRRRPPRRPRAQPALPSFVRYRCEYGDTYFPGPPAAL